MLLLPRRVYQDTRLTVDSANTSTTQITVAGAAAAAVRGMFAGLMLILKLRKKV